MLDVEEIKPERAEGRRVPTGDSGWTCQAGGPEEDLRLDIWTVSEDMKLEG